MGWTRPSSCPRGSPTRSRGSATWRCAMTRGWLPLTSDLQSHGSLRVIYGRVWPELRDPGTVLPFAAPAVEDPSDGSARLGGLTALIALLAIVTTYAVFARL